MWCEDECEDEVDAMAVIYVPNGRGDGAAVAEG